MQTYIKRSARAFAVGDLLFDEEIEVTSPKTVPPGETFSLEYEGKTMAGRATVAEVAPCVFVFTIYAEPPGGFNHHFITHTMVAAMKPESPSLSEVRAKCLPPTEIDEQAYRKWLKTTASQDTAR